MDDAAFIIGLMSKNSDALGFIPDTTLRNRYIKNGQYIIQYDHKGYRTGYLLFGKTTPGGRLTIAQTVIDYDYREQGQGRMAMMYLIERAKSKNVRCIDATVGEDLIEACAFFPSLGFDLIRVIPANNRRNRDKNVFRLDLWPTLFDTTKWK